MSSDKSFTLWGFPIKTASRAEILRGMASAGKVTVAGDLIIAQVGDKVFVDQVERAPEDAPKDWPERWKR